jgi:hypothetical protein
MVRSLVVLTLCAVSVYADPAVADEGKSQYHLFDPTPRALMREMSTDRPDKTESAYTVDAGHFQLEADAVTYTRDWRTADDGEPDTEAWSFATTNLKLGLLNNVDVQLVVSPYAHEHFSAPGDSVTLDGFGDTTVRLKLNLWGNDGGPTALALMPFVTFPTAQDDLGAGAVEGGLIVPLAVELPAGWGMGLMTQLDRLRDDDGDGYHFQWTNTATVGRDIAGDLGGYVEFFSSVNTEDSSDWEGTVDFGLTYAVTDDLQLDAGINVGVTDSADDLMFFMGVSWRR